MPIGKHLSEPNRASLRLFRSSGKIDSQRTYVVNLKIK